MNQETAMQLLSQPLLRLANALALGVIYVQHTLMDIVEELS
ncbi:hypothetical protein ACKF11_05345 [Methylobacillus sp. Pita2]|nr:hypothetical protein [Methylobacillus flagellatus]